MRDEAAKPVRNQPNSTFISLAQDNACLERSTRAAAECRVNLLPGGLRRLRQHFEDLRGVFCRWLLIDQSLTLRRADESPCPYRERLARRSR
jgi:hypothetical protein